MNIQPDELVSVIVPAYNAELTLDETLRSVRAQTYAALEILVIDDGSIDRTVEIAARHAGEDPRIRLIRQPNGGVAAARNHGIAEARGALVAPVDADDLWRPAKIERQVEALRAAGDKAGLAYTWFALIDERSRVISTTPGPRDEGFVLARMCRGNLVGNGSSPLMLRAAVLEAGGYDESLRARGAQGCEDLKLYFLIAKRYSFACVGETLTGYRMTHSNMSSDALQMLRSFDLVMGPFRADHPEHAAQFHRGRNEFLRWLAMRALQAGRWASLAKLVGVFLRHDMGAALQCMARLPWNLARLRVRQALRRLAPGAAFGGGPYLTSVAA